MVNVGGAAEGETLLARGAEAVVARSPWMGLDAVAKRRLARPYRHPALDQRLRATRTRLEAQLLAAARRAGVPTPLLLDADVGATTLRASLVPGRTLRQQLPLDPDPAAAARLQHLGALTARLHAAGLTHGDLTTSNVLVPEPSRHDDLVLLDFGLGAFTEETEPRGVDLHLVEEALHATDARATALVEAFLHGYRSAWPRSQAVLARLGEIRERGRYR